MQKSAETGKSACVPLRTVALWGMTNSPNWFTRARYHVNSISFDSRVTIPEI